MGSADLRKQIREAEPRRGTEVAHSVQVSHFNNFPSFFNSLGSCFAPDASHHQMAHCILCWQTVYEHDSSAK